MDNYIIHCTTEQTCKALELGAPIERIECLASIGKHYISGHNIYDNGLCYFIPTAEQMIDWLRDKDIHVNTPIGWGGSVNAEVTVISTLNIIVSLNRKTRKEATLAAIDVALEYLSNKK